MMKNKSCKFVISIAFLMLFSALTAFAQQGETRKYDEYPKLPAKDENARLDGLVLEMKADAGISVYIISYGGRRSAPKEALTMANRAKTYIAKKGKLKAARIVAVNGGYKDDPTTELWIMPAGATPPTANPTVDPSEVTPPKPAKKAKVTKKKRKG